MVFFRGMKNLPKICNYIYTLTWMVQLIVTYNTVKNAWSYFQFHARQNSIKHE